MLLSDVKKILSVIMAVVLIVPITVIVYADSEDAKTTVLLPCEVPFKIIVAENGKQGMIYSEEFEVVNEGDNAVEIEIYAARIQIESDDDYSISDTSELPESGSNIFIEILYPNDEEAPATILSETPSGVAHTYHLGSGEIGKFKFGGTVNELGPSWDDTVVQIHICFRIVGAEPIAADEEQTADLENDGENEALTPAQEATHNIDVTTDTINADDITEADDTNDADVEDAQESQPATETDTEKLDRDDPDIEEQTDEASDVEDVPSSDKDIDTVEDILETDASF